VTRVTESLLIKSASRCSVHFAHPGNAFDSSVGLDLKVTLPNMFLSIKNGIEGRKFEVSAAPAGNRPARLIVSSTSAGRDKWQTLQVTNSDPVIHKIHPLAQINREWNHSQGQDNAPLAREVFKPEVMIQVKCDINSWMHAFHRRRREFLF
jgi:hypothetical protein